MNIREASRDDAEGIAAVHVDSWKTTYKGIISEAVLSNLSVEKRKNSWLWTFDNLNTDEKLFVAEKTDGKIVGFSNGGRRRDEGFQQDGELYAFIFIEGLSEIRNWQVTFSCGSRVIES